MLLHLPRGDEGHDVHQADAYLPQAARQPYYVPVVHAGDEHRVDFEGQPGAECRLDAAHLAGEQDFGRLLAPIDIPLVADPGIDLLPHLAIWGVDGDCQRRDPGVEKVGQPLLQQ